MAVLLTAALLVRQIDDQPADKASVRSKAPDGVYRMQAADGEEARREGQAEDTKRENDWLPGKLLSWQGFCLLLPR